VTVAAFAVRAAPAAIFGIEAELQERVELVGGFHVDRAAVAAIAA